MPSIAIGVIFICLWILQIGDRPEIWLAWAFVNIVVGAVIEIKSAIRDGRR